MPTTNADLNRLLQRLRNQVLRHFPGRPNRNRSKPLLRKIDEILFLDDSVEIRQKARVSRRDWFALKRRYDNTCVCCRRKEPAVRLTADHVLPVAAGGLGEISNVQPLCRNC